ncbi:MAG: sodium:solute symporter family protein [Ignavibacteria bacterium]
MVSFSNLDISIIITFFVIVLLIGFLSGRKEKDSTEGFLLSGRKVGLFLFILTNVATWYGGILGVGEFTYRYGIVSWFTQGLPYYFFAIIFALLFAKKVRESSLFTIPDKLEEAYGRKVGLLSALLVFILVSPAPYLLMLANLITLIFGVPILYSLLIAIFLSAAYLFKGGYKSDLTTDAFEFFVMFTGFIVIFFFAYNQNGGMEFLSSSLPESHLKLTGGTSITFVIVWFLIALWTFTDPGFHQRCYAAKSGKVAKYGIIISVLLWALFDFLTTSTGLYSKAVLQEIDNPVLAFPLLAEEVLSPGFKGIFYAALFATILSTLNSFLFLSATTIGKDFICKLKPEQSLDKVKVYTRWGLLIAAIISVVLAYSIDSVIELWYSIGSLCIPSIIILVIGAYYKNFLVSKKIAAIEMITAFFISLLWFLLRDNFGSVNIINEIEPMVMGLTTALLIHLYGIFNNKNI